jgi:hypothetical protein
MSPDAALLSEGLVGIPAVFGRDWNGGLRATVRGGGRSSRSGARARKLHLRLQLRIGVAPGVHEPRIVAAAYS